MSVGRQNFSQRGLIFPAGIDTLPHFVNKMIWNVLNVFLAVCHEGERPNRMPLAFGTMTVWLSTAQMLLGQRTGKQIFGELEPLNKLELTLAEMSRLRPFRAKLGFLHLIVILP